jgi:hypothetical protein
MESNQQLYCHYYQANVQKELCWFVTAILKSYEHVAFDRTINTAESKFEFFVAPATEQYFLELMSYFQAEGLISNLSKQTNRLSQPSEQV